MSEPEITDRMKANWACANAIETRRLRLNPALRRAYTRTMDGDGEPDFDAMREAIEEAERIAKTLKAGLSLAGEPLSLNTGMGK